MFKRKYHNGIKGGTITETVRYWLDWKAEQVAVGKLTYVYGLGYIMVDSMDKVKLDDLTEEDVKRCGEEDLDSFRKSLLETYSKLFPDRDLAEGYWYRLRFRYMYEEIPLDIEDA